MRCIKVHNNHLFSIQNTSFFSEKILEIKYVPSWLLMIFTWYPYETIIKQQIISISAEYALAISNLNSCDSATMPKRGFKTQISSFLQTSIIQSTSNHKIHGLHVMTHHNNRPDIFHTWHLPCNHGTEHRCCKKGEIFLFLLLLFFIYYLFV